MENKEIKISYTTVQLEELSAEDRQLIEKAKEATKTSFSPYSHFSVGAAALLENGKTVKGSNQENASYTTGICAERCTVFYANAHYPGVPLVALAIAARKSNGRFTPTPVSPCGACRQVLAEVEHRGKHPVRLLLYGENEIYVINSMADVLPLQFNDDSL